MENTITFCYVLRPYSLGLDGMVVTVGALDSGNFEAYALLSEINGKSHASRLEFSSVVDLDTVIEKAQIEAQSRMPNPYTPVVWIRSTSAEARTTELSAVHDAVEAALTNVKSPDLRDVFARTRPLPAPVGIPLEHDRESLGFNALG